MKKLLFILMIIPMIGFGQTKIRNTQLTSGNQPSGKVLKSDGATNVVWGDDDGGTGHDSLTIAPGSTPYFDVNYPQIFSGQKLIDSLGVINTKIAGKAPASGSANYVQVSPSSPQVGNVWMGGSGTFDYGINVTTGSVNSYIHDGTGWIWSSTGISSGIIRGGIYAASDGSLNLFGGSTFSPNLKINNLGESIFSKKVQVGDYTSSSKFGAGGNSTTMNYHAYEDWTVTNSTLSPNLGYASFDAKPELTGSSINDHFVGFQSRPIYSSSGNLSSYMHGIDISCQHIGVGTISKSAQLNISDVGGLGPITNDYGIYISNISRGINNYSIYSDGGTAFFAGDIISGEDIVGGTLTIAGADLSTYKLAVGGDVWTDGNFTTTNGGGFFNNIKYNSGWKFVRNGYGNAIYQSGANLIFSAFGSGNSGDTAIESQCFVIKNNSAALLPTTASTSPTTGALTVAGGIGVSGDVNVFGFTNSSAYKLSGVDLFSSLTNNRIVKWSSGAFTNSFIVDDGGNILFLNKGDWTSQTIFRTIDNKMALSDYNGVSFGGYNDVNYGERGRMDGYGNASFDSSMDVPIYKLSGVDLFGSLSSGWIPKWDGTKFVNGVNLTVQSLSGTTPTLNASNGVNANLSISGNTTLTLSNLISGTSGSIYLTNNASVYRIKIAGYTIAPASNITYDSTGILLPASSVYTHTSIGWYYNGTTVQIHKADYNLITH